MSKTAIHEDDTEETLRRKRETVTKLIVELSKVKTLFFEACDKDKLKDEIISEFNAV